MLVVGVTFTLKCYRNEMDESSKKKSEDKHKPNPEEQVLENENQNPRESVTEVLKQSAGDFKDEEEVLQQALEKLKKENYSLKTSIKAWQVTLEAKLKEFKEIELKLDDFYNEIWSERERFCLKADEFNEDVGILSNWWQNQISFVSDLEKLKQKRKEERECRENIEKLQREIETLKTEVEELTELKKISVEVEVHLTENEDVQLCGKVPSPERVEPMVKIPKHVRFLEPEEEISDLSEVVPPNNELYSLMNVEKVRMANRKRNLRNKNERKTKPP